MHVAQNWRLRGVRYSMAAARCNTCDAILLANRGVCPRCAQAAAASSQELLTSEIVDRTFATIAADSSPNTQFEFRQAAR